jgi:hypothetical protein
MDDGKGSVKAPKAVCVRTTTYSTVSTESLNDARSIPLFDLLKQPDEENAHHVAHGQRRSQRNVPA